MIKILSFYDSLKHYEQAIKEYQKRLWKEVEIVKLKASKRNDIQSIIEEESKILAKELDKYKWYKVLLYIEWKEFDTLEFREFVEDKMMKIGEIIFIIWWAYWVDINLLDEKIDFKLSLSKLTFPHLESILILYEQIYRVLNIKKWWKYHH